jgi:inner membrane protein
VDNLTHTLLGVALADAGLSRRFGRGATLALALASNLPDVDALAALALGEDLVLVRRRLTHSLIGIPLLAAAGAAVQRLGGSRLRWRTLLGLYLLGMGVHLLFDLVNSFGVVLLSPLDGRRFELAWIFIVDPVLLSIPLASALLVRLRSSKGAARIALAAVGAYVGLCGFAHAAAVRILERRAREEGVHPDLSYVFPEPLGPHRFRGVLRAEGEYRTYLLHVLGGRAEPRGRFPTDAGDPRVQAARATRAGAELDAFFMAPVWRWFPEAEEAEVFDLRFRPIVLERPSVPFVYRVRATADGRGQRRRVSLLRRSSAPDRAARVPGREGTCLSRLRLRRRRLRRGSLSRTGRRGRGTLDRGIPPRAGRGAARARGEVRAPSRSGGL